MKAVVGSFISLLFAATGCVHTTNQAADPKNIRSYEDQASQLLTAIEKKESNDKITDQAKALISLGEGLVQGFMKQHPECTDYLKKAMVALGQLETITPEDMEKNYHKDAALPQADAKCYHAKDLVIHPATVVVLARDGKPADEKMADEIREVIAHLKVFEKSIATPQ